MYKKSSIILTAIILTGCQSGMDGADWSSGDGCERYFSETARELAACKAYRDAQSGAAMQKMSSDERSVTTSAVDAEVGMTEGIKKFESSEQNISE